MRTPSNEVHEHTSHFADFRYNRNAFEVNRPSPFSISTTSGSFPPLFPAKRSSWKSLSFGKFSSKPIRLSILKLDGSSFDIVVSKRSTVAKLKKAVEAAFGYMPTQGEGKISWSHVWGQFCLCFENMKLLRDRDSITRFGIKNGDQLQFVRRTPIYEVAGERLDHTTNNSDEPEGSSSSSTAPDLSAAMKKGSRKNQSNRRNHVTNEVNRSSWVCTMRELFLLRQPGTNRVSVSTTRLGRIPCDDADISCRFSADSDMYSSNFFSGVAGGFGYPSGYCPEMTFCTGFDRL